jgi:hypothetical protein
LTYGFNGGLFTVRLSYRHVARPYRSFDPGRILPYKRWRDIPAGAYLRPEIMIANLGDHLPLFNRYYAWLLKWHIAHHYNVVHVDQTNVPYRGEIMNAGISNFTIYNPLPDFLFGTACQKMYKESK